MILLRRGHFGVIMVPQQSRYVLERLGKFHRTLEPGLSFAIPLIDKIAYVHSLKENIFSVERQSAITQDNVLLTIGGVLYWRVTNPFKASYHIDSPANAITQLAQTAMRSELGKLTLDATLQGREKINSSITETINSAAEGWGLECLRYEIKELAPSSEHVRATMDLQSSAERQKRQTILDAKGKAEATLRKAKANADSIEIVAKALGQDENAQTAASLRLTEAYMDALGNIGKGSNTVVIPMNIAEPSKVIGKSININK